MKKTMTLLLVVLLVLSVLAPPASAMKDDPRVPRPTIRVGSSSYGAETDDYGFGDPKQRSIVDDADRPWVWSSTVFSW